MTEAKHPPRTNKHSIVGLSWMRDLSLRYKLMAIVMLTEQAEQEATADE